jgi:hypothetical protein
MVIQSYRSLLVACLLIGQFTPALAVGCGKDTDCKGERICEKGVCREPEAAIPQQKDSVYSTRPRPAPPVGAAATQPTSTPPVVVQPVVPKQKTPTRPASGNTNAQ